MIIIEPCPYALTPSDTRRINQLMKLLSPNGSGVSRHGVQWVLQRGFLFLARDTENLEFVFSDPMIVGMASIHFIQKLAGLTGQLEEVVVDEKYRRRGIATKLYEAMFALARERKAVEVYWTSQARRTEANLFYEKMGIEKYPTNVYRAKLNSA